MFDVLRFWLDLGLDGFRLDAVPYLFERDGTNGENLPETHEYLKRVRKEVDAGYPGRVLLAEANQWPADVVDYFGDGDECHMCFHFPLMPRMFMALRREQRHPITEILAQTPDIPDGLPVGHLPAQPRRADARDGDRRRAGLHVRRVRQGPPDEAEHRDPPAPRPARRQRPAGDGAAPRHAVLPARQPDPLLRRRDRHGRQHLPRRPRRRAHADAVVAGPQRRLLQGRLRPALLRPADGPGVRLPGAQRRRPSCATPSSLLHWIRRMLEVRKQHPLFGVGSFEVLSAENPSVLAFVRELGDDVVLCVNNLSAASPNRSSFRCSGSTGRTPIELLGRVPFPRIGELPYLAHPGALRLLLVPAHGDATLMISSTRSGALASTEYLPRQRWFGAKDTHIDLVRVTDDRGAAPELAGARTVEAEVVPGRDRRSATYQLLLGLRPGREHLEFLTGHEHAVPGRARDRRRARPSSTTRLSTRAVPGPARVVAPSGRPRASPRRGRAVEHVARLRRAPSSSRCSAAWPTGPTPTSRSPRRLAGVGLRPRGRTARPPGARDERDLGVRQRVPGRRHRGLGPGPHLAAGPATPTGPVRTPDPSGGRRLRRRGRRASAR